MRFAALSGRASPRRCARASRPRWWRPRGTRRPRATAQQRLRDARLPGVLAITTSSASSWPARSRTSSPSPRALLEGLGLGHNPRAALITRGLAEITRLGVATRREPAHLRRPGRHGRPGPHHDRQSEPQPRARRGAGGGAESASSTAPRTGAWRKAPTRHAPARRWGNGWASSCRSSSKSVKFCSAASRRARRSPS